MPSDNSPISAASVHELQAILREEYGVEMTHEETVTAAKGYIDYFDTLAEMEKENNENDYEKTAQEK